MSEQQAVPPAYQPEPEAGPLRLIVTLTLAGLLSGLILVGVYRLTLPRIQANERAALEAAVFEVLPGTARTAPYRWEGGELRPAPEGEEGEVYAGFDEQGRFTGWALPAKGPGFQDDIRLIYGYDPAARRVRGMRVLESRETPGLGDRVGKDPDFLAGFEDLAVEPEIVPVHAGEKSAPNEVDCITGATISSKAVVRIINRSQEEWRDRLPVAPPAGEGS